MRQAQEIVGREAFFTGLAYPTKLRDFGGDGKIEDKNMWTFYTKHARA
jgi:hypothetical protein